VDEGARLLDLRLLSSSALAIAQAGREATLAVAGRAHAVLGELAPNVVIRHRAPPPRSSHAVLGVLEPSVIVHAQGEGRRRGGPRGEHELVRCGQLIPGRKLAGVAGDEEGGEHQGHRGVLGVPCMALGRVPMKSQRAYVG
jgi:hypothetical protein